ncbi:MAG: filamentous hemagglutinin N-terminal domain-containing protein [Coleofasciculus sp. S288]|nr:filamentous hemagglutinin N-terminal domain-containing protein [Coleofasciculus sp. S288]
MRSEGTKLGLVLAKAKKATRLSALCAICAIASFGNSAIAQNITLDGSLGTAGTLTGPDYVIPQNVGQTVGNNLFHSFGQFNLDTGESAGFQSAANIRNILSRVTGGEISSIDGRIFTESPNVNLFLINPAGIVFGPNASIDVGSATRGSFIATTANAIAFGSQGAFVASTAQTDIPLLTIDPSAFLFNQIAAAPVVSQAILQVNPGQSLLLVGGDVSLNGGQLLAPGGRVELGGVADSGNIGLNTNGNELRLSFPDSIPRADVFLNNRADVNVRAGGGGSIAVNAHNLTMAGQSRVDAGIDIGLGSVGSQAGNIEIDVIEAILLTNGSAIQNAVLPGTGQGGDLIISTGSLSLKSGSQLLAVTLGQGDAGKVNVQARDTVTLDGESANGRFPSGIFSSSAALSSTAPESVGKGGDISITTGSLFVTNGALIQSLTIGQRGRRGNAGNITIDARDTISFDGERRDGFPSGAISSLGSDAIGKGGDISITTRSLFLTNGAILNAETRGQGDAGNVIINAHDNISFEGVSSRGSGGVYSNVSPEAVGKGGDITITAASLSITNGATLSATTFGQGNAGSLNIEVRDTFFSNANTIFSSVEETAIGDGGDIIITTDSLVFTNGAALSTSTFGQGNAGNVTINTQNFTSFEGVDEKGFSGGAFSVVGAEAEGTGGNISITTGSLAVSNGAFLSANTSGEGDAGSVIINASDRASFSGVNSGAYSTVEIGAMGNAKDIMITTPELFLTNGALLSASTGGQGDGGNIILNINRLEAFNSGRVATTTLSSGKAGNITLNAADSITLVGNSGLFANTAETSTNRGGNLRINTGELIVRDGAQVTVSSEGSGNAGELRLEAGSVFLSNQGRLTGTTASGIGGNLTLLVEDIILMRNESAIATTAANNGDGGNITISAPFIIAVSSENSDIVANADQGFGGRIDITATGIYGLEFRDKLTPESDINASSNATGKDGIVEINTPDIDPSRGLANLPAELVNSQLDHRCQARGTQATSRFVNTGRGGLPLTPDEISSNTVWDDLRSPTADANTPSDSATVALPRSSTSGAMVEAQGWVKHPDGTVILTTQVPTATLYSSSLPPATCY